MRHDAGMLPSLDEHDQALIAADEALMGEATAHGLEEAPAHDLVLELMPFMARLGGSPVRTA